MNDKNPNRIVDWSNVPSDVKDELDEIKEDIREEWESLLSNEEGLDWDAIREHDVYKIAQGTATRNINTDKVGKEVKHLVEETMTTGGHGVGYYLRNFFLGPLQLPYYAEKFYSGEGLKTEEHKKLEDELKNYEEKLTKEGNVVKNELSVINSALNLIEPDLKYESNWLKENSEEDLIKELKRLRDGKYTTQEEIDAAISEQKRLIKEYTTHVENYSTLREKIKPLIATRASLVRDVEEVVKNENDFALLNDLMGRDYDLFSQVAVSLTNGAVDLVQGVASFGEAANYTLNPFGRFQDFLIDEDAHPVLQAFKNTTQFITGTGMASTRFNEETASFSQRVHNKIDQAQEYLSGQVEHPPEWDKIDSWADRGEWAANMFAGQVPQLALMFATSGQSAWISGSLLAASAGGQHLMGIEEQREIYRETGGLYGRDMGFDQMFWSSAAVGLAEGLSERVTLGQIKGVTNLTKGFAGKSVKETWKEAKMMGIARHMKKTIWDE